MILRPYILHPEWLGSDRVVALRDHLKLFFLKIGNVTDGAGRFEADAAMLRAALYPKELHKVSERDVKGMLEQIHIAGLVRLYTRAGKGFGEVTIYKQTDSSRKVRYPGPDAGEFNFASASPPARSELAEPALRFKPIRSEANKNEVCELAPAAPTPHHTTLSQVEWEASLREEWPGVEIAAELVKAGAYVRSKRGPKARLSRKFFVEQWLPGCERGDDDAERPSSSPVLVDEAEPDGWRDVLADTQYGPGGALEVKTWAGVSKSVKAHVRSQLAEMRRVSA